VVLENGREIGADTIVTGAGIEPNTDLARTASMELDNDRIPCDASMQTVAPGVLVAGDAAYAWNATARRRLVVQHWGEAERMGEIAGHVAADHHDAWTQAPGFWSTIGDHTLKHVAWGDGYDETRLVEGGDDDTFAVLYGQRGTLVGVLASNLDDVYEQGGGLVEAGASLHEAAATLADAARVSNPAS
jgi:3-phenylpropionate/trans-cinnamate dioxygenase ferredoxin reductase component